MAHDCMHLGCQRKCAIKYIRKYHQFVAIHRYYLFYFTKQIKENIQISKYLPFFDLPTLFFKQFKRIARVEGMES